MNNLYRLLLASLLSSSYAHAQTSDKSSEVNLSIEIKYESASWNKDPRKVEAYPVIIRDAATGKSALITLTESAANSGIFSSTFQFNFDTREAIDITKLEIYIPPPQTPLSTAADLQNFLTQDHVLHKRHFTYQEKKTVHIQLFDSEEQVLDAGKHRHLYVAQQAHLQPTTMEDLAAQRHQQALADARLVAELNNKKRQAIEEQEQAHMFKLLQEQAALNNKVRDQRKEEAASAAQQASALYAKDKFKEASALFNKAYTLDPETDTYLYQYGVCLYKLDKYNQSIAILDLANDPSVNVDEKHYYRGLDLMKLKDLDKAWTEFNDVQKSQDPALNGPAAFFAGLIDFQNDKFDRAKQEFEFVLENSKDPKLDGQAETYLGQINNAQAFALKKSKRWSANVAGGMMYDSNILNLANGGSATNIDGFRANYQASGEYRLIYQQDHEWSAYFGGSDMYSMTTSFQPTAALQSQDPLQSFIYLPYRWRGKLHGTAGQLSVSPGLESINMDPYLTGTRSPILNSWVVRSDWTYLAGENHMENHDLELRRDISFLPADPADNLSAYKATYTWTNTFLKGLKKDSAWVYDLIFTDNAADGSNQAFYQFGAAGTYVTPWKWQSSVSGKVGASYSMYPQNTSTRVDSNLNLTGGFRKPLNKTLAAVGSITYLLNNSTLGPYAYNKYTVGASLAWSTDF